MGDREPNAWRLLAQMHPAAHRSMYALMALGAVQRAPRGGGVTRAASAVQASGAATLPRFARLFEAELPHGLCVGLRLDPDVDPSATAMVAPHPREAEMAASMSSQMRSLTFCGGRAALREAMRARGLPECDAIGRSGHGAPILPAGLLASISHTHGVAAALIGECSPEAVGGHSPGSGTQGRAVGLDVEDVRRAFSLRIASRVLTAREVEAAARERAAGELERAPVLLRFSLKEAAYKALSQLELGNVGWHSLSLTPSADGSVSYVWEDRGMRAASPSVRAALHALDMELRWTVLAGYFVTTARVTNALPSVRMTHPWQRVSESHQQA